MLIQMVSCSLNHKAKHIASPSLCYMYKQITKYVSSKMLYRPAPIKKKTKHKPCKSSKYTPSGKPTISTLETEQSTPSFPKRINNQRGNKQSNRNSNSNLNHSETQARQRGILGRGDVAVSGRVKIVPDLICVLQARDQGATGRQSRRHQDEDTR